jgi:NADPH2:quinone reductase
MRAVLCKSLDGPDALEVAEIARPEPRPGEILIAVRAVALNFFDTLIIRGKYQFQPGLPFSPGGEVAGTVAELGEGVTGFAPGQRVMAYVQWDGAREFVSVPAESAVALPDGVDDETAAGLTITYGTAMHGLVDRGRLRPGETVVVLGATGGAGLAAVEIAHLLGATVIAAGTSDEKLALCRDHGADELLNLAAADDLKQAIRDLTGGQGADIVYDCIGGPYAEPAVRATAWEGRYLVIGFAAGDIPRIPLNLLLLKGCEMIGVFFSRFAARNPAQCRGHLLRVLDWCREGRLRPHVDQVFPLEQTADALRALEARKIKGKVVIRL